MGMLPTPLDLAGDQSVPLLSINRKRALARLLGPQTVRNILTVTPILSNHVGAGPVRKKKVAATHKHPNALDNQRPTQETLLHLPGDPALAIVAWTKHAVQHAVFVKDQKGVVAGHAGEGVVAVECGHADHAVHHGEGPIAFTLGLADFWAGFLHALFLLGYYIVKSAVGVDEGGDGQESGKPEELRKHGDSGSINRDVIAISQEIRSLRI